uniref:BHLH domain-containing protein n=1 Tax=Trichuris muris TaxID=70415 RepID=A0A5S6QLS1_TRIMR
MFEPVIGNVGAVDSSTDRKKQVHLKCEKMRREAIKVGYNELKDMLPPEAAPVGYKLTNASILYRAAEFLKKLKLTEKQQSEEISKLHSQLVALQIICQNYAQMAVQKSPTFEALETDTVPYLKFELFRALMDFWFESFNNSVEMEEYCKLAQSMLQWFEQKLDFNVVSSIFDDVYQSKRN